jgi:uncharacterized protein (DUF302 family)
VVAEREESAMLYTVNSTRSIDDVSERLQKSIADRGFGVMTVHDLKRTLQKKGVDFDRECHVFEVCNPDQARKVLERRMDISTALPCRISVFVEAGQVKLSTIKPTVLLDMFGDAELKPVAAEVEEVMLESMHEAAA